MSTAAPTGGPVPVGPSPLTPGSTSRLRGVDAARGTALVGMMAVHVLPDVGPDGQPSTAYLIASGRAAALFAVLAGVGLALLSGGAAPMSGAPLAAMRRQTSVRAVVLLALGLLLGSLPTPVAVILPYYALLFCCALPFLGLSAPRLAALAAGWALVAPILSHALRIVLPTRTPGNPSIDALADPLDLLRNLTLTGYYPVLPWMAYLLAGLAVGRLALRSVRVATGLLLGGSALALLAASSSSLLLGPLGGYARLLASIPDRDVAFANGLDVALETGLYGTTPTTSPWWLAVAAPHSSTPLDLLHTIGTALAVLGLMLLVAQVASRLLVPIAAAGSMTLTLYFIHAAALGTPLGPTDPAQLLAVHVAAALVLATAWRATLGRGPLERLTATLAQTYSGSDRP